VDVVSMKSANALDIAVPLTLLPAQTRWSNTCCLLHCAMSLVARRVFIAMRSSPAVGAKADMSRSL